MPVVTTNVRTWGFAAFPASERLLIRFVPSSAAGGGGHVYPLREESVEPASNGDVSVTLAQTTTLIPDVYFSVRFEWFSQHPITGEWTLGGWSELPGELRVPAAGGDLATLRALSPRPGSILYGYGAPPSSLDGVIYLDVSGMKPKLYAPKGTLI